MVRYEVFEAWQASSWKKRDAAYTTLKEKLAQQIFADIEKRYPGWKDAVAAYNISTPLTTNKFLSREKGSSYGIPFTTERANLQWLSAKTPYKNLHLAGQDVFGPGIMAAMMGGVSAAANTLGLLGYFKVMKAVTTYQAPTTTEPPQYHQARVVERIQETEEAATFVLELVKAPPFSYQAGQFVVVEVSIGGKSHKRSYSLSSGPDEALLKITIKRVPKGKVSNYFLDQVQPGAVLNLSTPKGRLCIDKTQASNDLVFVAAGSGITPLYAIIKDTLENQLHNTIRLLYANKNQSSIIFDEALQALQERYPSSFEVQHFLSQPLDGQAPQRMTSEALIQALRHPAGKPPCVLVCAPEGLVKMAKAAADQMGIPEDQFKYESFTTKPLNLLEQDIPSVDADLSLRISHQVYQTAITKDKTLLEGLLESGIPIDHSCRSGDCGLCACSIKSGEVVAVAHKEVQTKTAGEKILPCVCYAGSSEVELLKH